MTGSVTVRIDDTGHALAVKEGADETAARRRREAEALQRLAGLGTPILRDMATRSRDGREVVTVEVDHHVGRSLDLLPALDLEALIDLSARLARVLHEVHAAGVLHGAVRADHVLVAPDGSVRLCGLGDATVFPDPGAGTVPFDTSVDDAALAALIGQEYGRSLAAGQLAESAPRGRRLARLAAPTSGPPLTSGELADRLDELDVAEPTATPTDDSVRRPPRRWLAPVAGGVVVAVLAGSWLATRGGDEPSPPTTAVTTAVTPTTAVVEPSVVATQPSPCPEVAFAGAADGTVDPVGDGCLIPFRVEAGQVRLGPRAFELGEPDDLIALGDWNCDGVATPALVRRATGAVFLFTAWPDDDGAVTAEAVATVSGPTSVGVAVSTTGCDTLVITGDGGVVEIPAS